ncbi:hypothetical protein HNQ94_003145 [Salirhabdus euzebyi]|uniref:YhzD-like protein n=1 Tax=Salirhabdus euzebyi TaxID=394506 RepID=A0A841Q8C9_9BACI|nr:YhzD family protein [Salirhabdus euzebyi]MBB6454656.1 hypothetical protein [Salirhabdus euzebyi]
MKSYTLTVFEKDGKTLLDESFEANNDQEAKEKGTKLLEEKGYENHTHRCVTEGRLVLFHR